MALFVLLGCEAVVSAGFPCTASSVTSVLVGAVFPSTLPLPLPPALPPLCGVALPLTFESSRLFAAALRTCSSVVSI